MMNQQADLNKLSAPIVYLLMLIAVFFGCVSQKVSNVKVEEPKRILDVIMSEDSKSVNITIKGNRYLSYSALTQDSPKGVLFNFSDTSLGNIESVYIPAENEIISSIETNELVGDKKTKSSIFITLKKDTSYDVTPMDEGLLISFPKPSEVSKKTILEEELTEKKPENLTPPISAPASPVLEEVIVSSAGDNVIINIKADGVIRDYESFTLNNPARIVFDMYNLESPYQDEQIIAVESKGLNRIRHFAHPDKIRLVLDTYQDYLSNFSASSIHNGLLIQIVIIPVSQPE